MKIIEAMRRVKINREKIADLQAKIAQTSAHTSIETPAYPDPKAKVAEWAQACTDLCRDNITLLTNIARTNLATNVTINVGGHTLNKTIAEWVWRRREYAAIDLKTHMGMTDRNLREGQVQSSTGVATDVKIVRNYEPEQRDKMVAMYKAEPHEIDAALEIANAVTDLITA